MARGTYRVSSLWITLVQLGFIQGTACNLIEEDIFAVTAFCGKVFQVAVLVDTMLLTQLLPKLTTNFRRSVVVLAVKG